jgi:hypothetical protein
MVQQLRRACNTLNPSIKSDPVLFISFQQNGKHVYSQIIEKVI